jgi:hypothetical protein
VNKRIAKRDSGADISPGLREHITQAAQQIRAAHKAELADILKADRSGRLFRSIIRPNGKPVGALKKTSGGSSESLGLLAGEIGGLMGDAIRAGTGLLEGSLTVLAQAWMTTVTGPAARPAPPQPAAERQMPGTTVDAAVPGGPAPGMPASSPEEVMLRGAFRQFMPMLLTALSQGGNGYGLAKTVIALFGRPRYDQACAIGKEGIMQLVRAEPDLWAQVAPMEATFSRFLDEFTGYDVWIAEQARQANKAPEPPRRSRIKPAAGNE